MLSVGGVGVCHGGPCWKRCAPLPTLEDSWLLLLFCCTPRCTHVLRLLPPESTAEFAAAHDLAVAPYGRRPSASVAPLTPSSRGRGVAASSFSLQKLAAAEERRRRFSCRSSPVAGLLPAPRHSAARSAVYVNAPPEGDVLSDARRAPEGAWASGRLNWGRTA